MASGGPDVFEEDCVYLIVVKFTTKPDWTDRWLDLVDSFTKATREEPGICSSSGTGLSRSRTPSRSSRPSPTTARDLT
jgi:hypothetical protein